MKDEKTKGHSDYYHHHAWLQLELATPCYVHECHGMTSPRAEETTWEWELPAEETAWAWELPEAPKPRPVVGLVAAKNPVSALIVTVESLFAGGAERVVVVDDGSDDPASMQVFDEAEQAGAEVIHLSENMGKSKALKVGFSSMHYDEGFIIAQVDDDTLAGDLTKPVQMIMRGKADIVDVRVETFAGTNLVSNVQQLDYWLINATIKRLQDWFRARLWLSGASLVYTSEAAQVLLMEPSQTQTEDTEGRYRAIGRGLKVRYCASKKSQFLTMIPETVSGMRKQWMRWALGNGQVIRLYGLGAGNARIAMVNFISWFLLLTGPVLQFVVRDWLYLYLPFTEYAPGQEFIDDTQSVVPDSGYVAPILYAILWMIIFGVAVGVVGAITLRRFVLVFVGVFIPVLSLYWAYHAVEGIVRSIKYPRAVSLTWSPPKRMDATSIADASTMIDS